MLAIMPINNALVQMPETEADLRTRALVER
jgi:hypothetical protein